MENNRSEQQQQQKIRVNSMIAHLRSIIEQLANPFERANQLIDSSIGGQKWFITEKQLESK